ncbi:penicillin-binding protein [Actinomadura harenae]|uniref:Penicillin-binding protein n=1 Tax=Actinomadura harenae TaxID=2483351 RepID=A0A3M2MEH8_9ACTN|nr:penicillin-binding protein [Actinomadura harenae]
MLAFSTLIVVGYMLTDVPTDAQKGVNDQGMSIMYANGTTPIARVGTHRQSVSIKDIPPVAQKAVLAAEDRNFYSETWGVSPKGLARAVYKTASGGDVQGGSTITQQLARNYYQGLSRDKTMSRKVKEIFISIKLRRKIDPNQILEMYLNTVPFGRNAYGIQAASQAYFHKDVKKIDYQQAAMLAAMIQRPSFFATQGKTINHTLLVERWHYVLKGMTKMGVITADQNSKAVFPKTTNAWSDVKGNAQAIYIQQRVDAELKGFGLDPNWAKDGGRITTTLEPKWMGYAASAMKEAGVKAWPKSVYSGLIAVDPANGEIKAFYGGDKKHNGDYDTVFNPSAQAGSSFKPYVLATALKAGFSIKSTIDGHSPQCFDGEGENIPGATDRTTCINKGGYPVQNDAGDGPMGTIDLVKATEKSVNTAYVKLGIKLHTSEVAKTAEEFGVPDSSLKPHALAGGGYKAGIALGIADVPAVNQAAGYAAFANGGMKVTPHLIQRIQRYNATKKAWEDVKLPSDKLKPKRILDSDLAAQADTAMQAVVRSGTATGARLDDGRQVAGKTGTTEQNVAAWFVGYIPQLSAAVTMFDKNHKTIQNIPGFQGNSVYGGTIPAKIWKSFMEKVIHGENIPSKDFPTPTYSGTQPKAWDTPTPTDSPTDTPTDTPSCPPGQTPGPGKGRKACKPTGPTSPVTTPPTTNTPPPGNLPPCMDRNGGKPLCDPNKPPNGPGIPQPKWWCDKHPDNADCDTTGPGNGGGGGGGGGGGNNGLSPQYAGTPREFD